MLKMVVDLFGETTFRRIENVEDFDFREGWVRTDDGTVIEIEGNVISYVYVG
ncbi:MAG: hypothetical protein J5617_03915 [Bacilli bacterium]|nr:hypothetical protein [Bacilli bacterium]